jgi:hypothetical protein
MDWIKLVIPLIAVAVWIISHLANQQKEIRRPPRVPPPLPPRRREPFDRSASVPASKPDDDNKYREEMDRKREKKPSLAKPIPRPRSKRLESAPEPTPVIRDVSRTAAGVRQDKPATDLYLPAPVVLGQPIAKVGEAAARIVKPAPAAVKNMLELLKRPDSLTTAFLLKEVLDLPVAKRPRRRK